MLTSVRAKRAAQLIPLLATLGILAGVITGLDMMSPYIRSLFYLNSSQKASRKSQSSWILFKTS